MADHMKRILVTGATGKVGSHFIRQVLSSGNPPDVTIRALCHNRRLEPHERLEMVREYRLTGHSTRRHRGSRIVIARPARKHRTT
jgi:hypothetical protein